MFEIIIKLIECKWRRAVVAEVGGKVVDSALKKAHFPKIYDHNIWTCNAARTISGHETWFTARTAQHPHIGVSNWEFSRTNRHYRPGWFVAYISSLLNSPFSLKFWFISISNTAGCDFCVINSNYLFLLVSITCIRELYQQILISIKQTFDSF